MNFNFFQGIGVLSAACWSMMFILSGPPGARASENLSSLPVKYLTLGESLRMARKNSITLKIDEKKLLAARLNVQNSDLDWIPDLLIGAGYRYEEINENSELGEVFPFLSLSQVVLNDFATYKTKLDAMNKLMSAEVQRETSVNQIYSDIIKKYFSLLNGQQQLQLENQFLGQRLSDFDKAENRALDGMISNLEFMQNEISVELAKIEQEVGRNRVEYLEFELFSLLNLQSEAKIVASDKFTPSFYPVSYAACKEYAQKNHMILKLNNRVLKRLPEFRKLAQRTTWPSVSLSAFLGSGANIWDSDNRYGLFVTATHPLYDFGKKDRRQQILLLELDTIEDSIVDFKRNFFSLQKFFYMEFVNTGNTVQKLHKQSELSGKLVQAVQKSYDLGVISLEEFQKKMNREKERKKDYMAAVSRYLAAEMLLKLNSGVADISIVMQQGPEWLTPGLNSNNGSIKAVTEAQP